MVVSLNSKKTLHWLTEKINKRVEATGGTEADVNKLLSIVHRHLNFHFNDAEKVDDTRHSVMLNHKKPIMVLDPVSMRTLFANHAAAKFYGYTRKQLEGMNHRQLLDLPLPTLQSMASKVMELKRSSGLDCHQLASGEPIDVEVNASPISFDNHDCVFMTVKEAVNASPCNDFRRSTRG